jgi:hypothetical protein
MNPLAAAVYEILRGRVGLPEPRITYAELARQCRESDEAFETVTHRSRELYAALWEVGNACRRLGLPPLPALVVRADSRRPGDAYYEGMPPLRPDERIAAWQRDLDAVRRAAYPTTP